MIRVVMAYLVAFLVLNVVMYATYYIGLLNPMYPVALVGCLTAWWTVMIICYGFPWKRPGKP